MLKEERREHLLSCALEVFAEKGYHSASVSDIIKKACVARGTFYLYFQGKRSVFDELLDGLLSLIHSKVKRIDPTGGLPGVVAQMEANVDVIMECFLENHAMTKIVLAEAVGLDPGFDKKLSEFYGRLLGLTERSLKQGIEMNIVRPINTQIAALCILGSIKEVLYQVTIGHKLPDRKILVWELLHYHVRGVCVPEVANEVWNRCGTLSS